MSEFKYACPVCGQHLKCDSSQSGTVMECPTCLQKIVAPQAPSDPAQKLILSGKKLEDRPKTGVAAETPLVFPKKHFPFAAVALFLLLGSSVAAAILFHDRLFHFAGYQASPVPATNSPATNVPPPKPVPPPEPPIVIPHASGTNWQLNLEAATIPDTPAAGRIHGQDFLCERSSLQGGLLTLRQGAKGTTDFSLMINFNGAPAEILAGKTINVTSNAPLAARVTLRWKETDQDVKDNFETGYALRLEFGPIATNHLSGKIYFCAPDDTRSYVAGTFTAEIRKPKPVKPKP